MILFLHLKIVDDQLQVFGAKPFEVCSNNENFVSLDLDNHSDKMTSCMLREPLMKARKVLIYIEVTEEARLGAISSVLSYVISSIEDYYIYCNGVHPSLEKIFSRIKDKIILRQEDFMNLLINYSTAS